MTPTSEQIKRDMERFYADEARDRDSEQWVRSGGSARVPESRASHYFIDRKVRTALALARLPRTSRVLEVGSSFGHMTFLLAERFREVVAVDISPESIDLARRRAAHWNVSNVRLEVADAEDLRALDPGGFDGAFCFSTLRFCPNPERALAEMLRLLLPGAPAVVDAPNRRCPWYGPIKNAGGIEPHIHDRLYESAELVEMMERTGFREVRARHVLFTTKRVPDLALPLFRLADPVLESLPGIRTMSGIVMARGRKSANG